jgi:hypothetical protein
MIKLASFTVVAGSLLLITAIVSGADVPNAEKHPAIVLEMVALESNNATTNPAADLEPLKLMKGKEVSRIKALAGQDGSFLAEASLGDHVMTFEGKIKSLDAKHYRVNVKYCDKSPGGIREITSLVEAAKDEPKAVGAMNAGKSRWMLVLNVSEQKPQEQ